MIEFGGWLLLMSADVRGRLLIDIEMDMSSLELAAAMFYYLHPLTYL